MRSLPFLLRSLAQATVVTTGAHERPVAAGPRAAGPLLARGWQGALRHVELDRMEAMVRRYQGKPPRIENPFAAFPTRAYWLGRMMKDPD